ncbi:hypothetical protein ACLB2K_007742 [Fragaria x ananassa]
MFFEPVPLHSIFPEDDEPVKTDVDLSKPDKLVAQAMQMAGKKINEETSLKNKGQQAEGVKKYVKKRKQTVEIRKEEEQEVYLQMLKEKVEKKKVSIRFIDIKAACMVVVHEQKLKEFLAGGGKQGEFKCNELDIEFSIINPLWSIFNKHLVFILLHHGVSNHYTLVEIHNKDRCFYHLNLMLPARKEYSADTNIHFQNTMEAVKHIMVFIKRVYDSTIYPLNQELDPEE